MKRINKLDQMMLNVSKNNMNKHVIFNKID